MRENTYISDLCARITPYVAGEQPRDQTYIKLNTNENPYPPSPRVAQAIARAAERLPLYPDGDSLALRQAIGKRHGLEPDWVFAGNGSDEVLAFAFLAFFAGKRIAAPDPTYSFYPVYAQLFGVDYETVPVDDDFVIDPQGLMKGAPVVLANPNAPTSRELPLAAIQALARHCKEHGHVLLVDEAYADFGTVSAVELLDAFDNLLIVRTFSKSHALAGARVGYALGHPALMAALGRIKDSFNSYPLDCVAQAAAQAAMEDEAYTRGRVEEIKATREWCAHALRGLGVAVLPSSTNFLFCRALKMGGAELAAALRARGILVRRLNGERIKDYLRITIGTREQMEAVIRAVGEILYR